MLFCVLFYSNKSLSMDFLIRSDIFLDVLCVCVSRMNIRSNDVPINDSIGYNGPGFSAGWFCKASSTVVSAIAIVITAIRLLAA